MELQKRTRERTASKKKFPETKYVKMYHLPLFLLTMINASFSNYSSFKRDE